MASASPMMVPAPEADPKALLHAAADRLLAVRRLLVLAGAGCSADAGIPTFRDEGGWWQEYRPEDLATPQAFAQDPELVWTWYRERRTQIRAAVPHAGQRSLALLQKHFYEGQVLVATTNEDDLLERAGIEAVVHLHGSIFDTTCSAACGWPGGRDAGDSMAAHPCPCCGAPTRPGSVWYGESLPPGPLEAIHAFDPDGCLVIGSSNVVQPVAGIPTEMALSRLPVVEINPQPTPLSSLALHLPGPAAELLPALVDLLTSATMRDQRRRLS